MVGKIAIEEATLLPLGAYQAAFYAPPCREDELVSDLLDIYVHATWTTNYGQLRRGIHDLECYEP